MKRQAISIIFLMLGGCVSSMQDFTPTMDSDPPEIGTEGLVLLNELGRAYIKLTDGESPYCRNMLPSFQERSKYSYKRYNADGQRTEQRFQCIGYKKADKEDVERHVHAGFALSNLYCLNFFDRIAEHANKRRFARNSLNDAGTAVSTALGLATAGSIVTGGAGAAFGLFDNGFRNYDENFLVTPDLQTLQTNVLEKQEAMKKATYAAMPTTYADADIAIRRHANYCSYTGMKALLTQAVVKDTEAASVEEASIQYQVAAATMQERRDAQIAEEKARQAEIRAVAAEKEKAAKAREKAAREEQDSG